MLGRWRLGWRIGMRPMRQRRPVLQRQFCGWLLAGHCLGGFPQCAPVVLFLPGCVFALAAHRAGLWRWCRRQRLRLRLRLVLLGEGLGLDWLPARLCWWCPAMWVLRLALLRWKLAQLVHLLQARRWRQKRALVRVRLVQQVRWWALVFFQRFVPCCLGHWQPLRR